MYQAIITKYLGPTDRRGTRVKAIAEAGTITLSWNHALNSQDNHAAAAKALAEKYQWRGEWHAGAIPGNAGYAFVQGDIGSGPIFVTYGRE